MDGRFPPSKVNLNADRPKEEQDNMIDYNSEKEEKPIGSRFFFRTYDPEANIAIVEHISKNEQVPGAQEYCVQMYFLDVGAQMEKQYVPKILYELEGMGGENESLPLFIDVEAHEILKTQYWRIRRSEQKYKWSEGYKTGNEILSEVSKNMFGQDNCGLEEPVVDPKDFKCKVCGRTGDRKKVVPKEGDEKNS